MNNDDKLLEFVREKLEGSVPVSSRVLSVRAAAERLVNQRRWWRWGAGASSLAAAVALAVTGFWGREEELVGGESHSVVALFQAEDEASGVSQELGEVLLAWQDAPYREVALDGGSDLAWFVEN